MGSAYKPGGLAEVFELKRLYVLHSSMCELESQKYLKADITDIDSPKLFLQSDCDFDQLNVQWIRHQVGCEGCV